MRDAQLSRHVGVSRFVAEQQSEVGRDVQDVLVVLYDPAALGGLGLQDVSGELVQLVLDD